MNEFEQAITEEIRHASRPFSIVREESPSSSREFLTVTLEGADTAAQQENLRQALKETFAMIEASASHNETPDRIFVTAYDEAAGALRSEDLDYTVTPILFTITTADYFGSNTDDFGVPAGSDTIEAVTFDV